MGIFGGNADKRKVVKELEGVTMINKFTEKRWFWGVRGKENKLEIGICGLSKKNILNKKGRMCEGIASTKRGTLGVGQGRRRKKHTLTSLAIAGPGRGRVIGERGICDWS